MNKSTNSNPFSATNKNLAKAVEQQQRILGLVVSKVGADAVAEEKRRKLLYETMGRALEAWLQNRPQEERAAFFGEIEKPMKKSERAIISTHALRPDGVDEIVAKADAEALESKREAEARKAQENLEKAKEALRKAEEKAQAVQAGGADDAALPVEDTAPDGEAAPRDEVPEAGKKTADRK